jgi:hypothetical protein
MWPSIVMHPDLSNAVTICLQFLTAPTYDHWEAAKGALRYLKHTATYKLTFRGNEGTGLVGYRDADGMTQEGRQALSGYVFLIDGGAVSWSSRK